MPLPARLGRINRRLANPLLRPLAERLPHFGVLVHRGRSSGRAYRTPVNVFTLGDEFVIALTYGPKVDWLANLLAAGRARLVHRGRSIEVSSPCLARLSDVEPALPRPVALLLGLLGVEACVRLRSSQAPPDQGGR